MLISGGYMHISESWYSQVSSATGNLFLANMYKNYTIHRVSEKRPTFGLL